MVPVIIVLLILRSPDSLWIAFVRLGQTFDVPLDKSFKNNERICLIEHVTFYTKSETNKIFFEIRYPYGICNIASLIASFRISKNILGQSSPKTGAYMRARSESIALPGIDISRSRRIQSLTLHRGGRRKGAWAPFRRDRTTCESAPGPRIMTTCRARLRSLARS